MRDSSDSEEPTLIVVENVGRQSKFMDREVELAPKAEADSKAMRERTSRSGKKALDSMAKGMAQVQHLADTLIERVGETDIGFKASSLDNGRVKIVVGM